MKKIIREGEKIPNGYGVAWLNIESYSATCYPLPLNVIFGFTRKIWINMLCGEWVKTAYDKGFEEGKEAGRKYAFNQYKKIALRGQLEDILKRFSDYIFDQFGKPKEEQVGWFWKFVEEENKKLYERS